MRHHIKFYKFFKKYFFIIFQGLTSLLRGANRLNYKHMFYLQRPILKKNFRLRVWTLKKKKCTSKKIKKTLFKMIYKIVYKKRRKVHLLKKQLRYFRFFRKVKIFKKNNNAPYFPF
jgi:hypothetical protein